MKWRMLMVALVICITASTATAQIPLIDHYYVYLLTQPIPLMPPPIVTLADQWGMSDLEVIALEKWANPADKNGEGIIDPMLHYSWYRIDEPNVGRLVRIDNQFGRQDWTVRDAKYLLTPASKDMPGGLFPLGNHYKCYDAFGPPLDIQVVIQDQWGGSTPMVLDPACFCNPTDKFHDPDMWPIVDPFAHLACYNIVNGHDGFPAQILDQFLDVSIAEGTHCLLCVPTDKLVTIPTEDSTWGRIKSLFER